jgi:16S rRNA C967 or C1407 C5-methylase (RsmB/RsmF family)
MTSPEDVWAHLRAARQQSKAVWDAMAPGWYARREGMWQRSHPVSEWMVQKLDPQSGDTVLELSAGPISAPSIRRT